MGKSNIKFSKLIQSLIFYLKLLAFIGLTQTARFITYLTGITRLEVYLIKHFNTYFEKPVIGGRKGPEDYFLWQYANGSKIYNYMDDTEFTFNHKFVLDLGCGRGGKTAFYKSEGARSVIGVDLGHETLKIASELSAKHVAGTDIYFLRANALNLPFNDDTFDHIILNDMVEHLFEKDLKQILLEMKRVIKGTGSIIIDFPPYYNRSGSHLYDYVYIPYCHLIFSEKALVDFCEKQASPFVIKQFLELNRLTASKFKNILTTVGLKPLSYKILRNSHTFARIPVIENLFIYRVFCVLHK